MPPYVGQLGAFGLAKEVVLGTFVAPTKFIPVHLPLNIGSPDITLLESKGIYSIPDVVVKAQQGPGMLNSAKVPFDLEPENGIGEVLMGAFGTDTVTGAGADKTHTFTRLAAAQLPTYSLWVKNGQNYPQFAAAMLNKLDINVKAKEFVKVEADYKAAKYVGGGVTHAVSYSQLNPLKFDQAVLTVAGGSVLLYEDIKLSIDNMVENDHVIGGSIYSSVIYSKAMKVTLSATIVVQDSTEWDKFIAGTATSFVVALTSGQVVPTTATPYSLTINMPNVYYNAAPLPLANGLIKIVFTATAVYDFGTSKTINAALVNSVAAAY